MSDPASADAGAEADAATLGGLSDDERSRLRSAGRARTWEEGEILFRRGEDSDALFLLEDGRVALTRTIDGGADAVLEPGAAFGIEALVLTSHRRASTAQALMRCRCRVIDQATIDALLMEQPWLVLRVLRHLATRLLRAESERVERLQLRIEELERLLGEHEDDDTAALDDMPLRANTDRVTGLYNQRYFDDAVQSFVKDPDPPDLALLHLHIELPEHLPDEDDTARSALQRVARTMTDSIRKTDLPFYLGHRIFGLLLLNISDADARQRAEALRVRLVLGGSAAATADGPPPVVSVSGTAMRTDDTVDSLIGRSRSLLQRARRSGQGRPAWG
ncbi:MAG: cyclic nucleotide-binding domain-containing protein [Acidobacteriota bacterium]